MDRYANKQNMVELSKAIHDKYSPTATTSSAGLMSASDKEKLDGIDVGANDYTLPLMSPTIRGGAKLDENGGLVLRDGALGIDSLTKESDGIVSGGIAELTAKGHAEQDGTPTPESPVEIQVVRGRNLLPMMQSATISGITATVADDGTITLNGTATGTTFFYCQCNIAPGTYTLSANNPIATSAGTVVFKLVDAATADMPGGSKQINNAYTIVGITIQAAASKYVICIAGGSTLSNYTIRLQLESGSTPHPYVPYGHVGLEVRQGSTVLYTTPIPLPQRGWVAGLPDGTADSLLLDGAGKCEWELDTSKVVLDGSSDENWYAVQTANRKYRMISGSVLKSPMSRGFADNVKASALCTAYDSVTVNQTYAGSGIGFAISPSLNMYVFDEDFQTAESFISHLSSHNVTVLYPLATPVTEDCGYVEDWPTDIPDSVTVSIPELDEVDVKYFIDSAVTELARQWYARANSEYADRLEALEAAVADLVTA